MSGFTASSFVGHRRLLVFYWLTAEAAVDRGVWLDRKAAGGEKRCRLTVTSREQRRAVTCAVFVGSQLRVPQ